jgi:hypothetical protein
VLFRSGKFGKIGDMASLKYRPSSASQLQASALDVLPEASNTVISQLFESVAAPPKKASIKGQKMPTSMGAAMATAGVGSLAPKLVVKKSAVLQPVKSKESMPMPMPMSKFEFEADVPLVSDSILEKSKLGTKASASKLGKLKLTHDPFAALSLPDEPTSSIILKGKSKSKLQTETGASAKSKKDADKE